jgi:hypothetical protein
MDLSQLPIKASKRVRTTDPQEIFNSLTLRGSVENLWQPQAEALKDWHVRREEQDIVVEMNTGGGKTLVGLLIAQSIVNQTQGKTLLVCSTNQLVEQTANRAAECGIRVATYMKTTWDEKTVYDSCIGSCLTNYAAVFNGKSIFRKDDIKGVIFDDAHVASSAIRGQFTIKIPVTDSVFSKLANLFRGHFARNSQSQQFEEALHGRPTALLFVPAFELRRNVGLISKILLDNGVAESPATLFAWAHLKDKLSVSTILISGLGIEISPPVLPTFATSFFGPGLKRVYLTATLPSAVEFIRTFGISNPRRITPGGKSGEAQRQFIFVPGETDEQQRENAIHLVKSLKTCIICPSTRAADEWPSEIPRFDGSQGQQAIDTFRAAAPPNKLILVARYDGVDLPGDSCRVLALDGIPTGSSLLERFIDQSLKIEKLRASHTATRIVQAIGRIFRSNTDHGVVFVCGTDLQAWLKDPNNQKFMPKLLQQQILLGLELRRMVDDKKATYEELIEGVLKGRKDWDNLYNGVIAEFDTNNLTEEPQWFIEAVAKERDAYEKLWSANGPLANTKYSAVAFEAETNGEPRLAAWFRHWQGLSLLVAGQDAPATVAFVQAANERVELGRPDVKGGLLDTRADVVPGRQAKKLSGYYKKNKGKIIKKLEKILGDLKYGPDTKPAEQALCDLGEVLGLEGSRPDNGTRTGPDVLWRVPEIHQGAALEAKTNKQPNSQYTKADDIGQFHDHVNWLQINHPEESFFKVIVGQKLSVAKEANPEADLRIIPLEQFAGLTTRLQAAIHFIESTALESDLEVCIERALQEFGLLWPMCVESLESILATDLKNLEKIPAFEA